jgi:DNA adenine methylase
MWITLWLAIYLWLIKNTAYYLYIGTPSFFKFIIYAVLSVILFNYILFGLVLLFDLNELKHYSKGPDFFNWLCFHDYINNIIFYIYTFRKVFVMNNLVKIHGGKSYLKDWIIDHFPRDYENYIYVEPYIGGGSIILNKEKSRFETINDKNPNLINLYNVVINNHEELINQLRTVEYVENTFNLALVDYNNVQDDPIDAAVNYYIICRMSRNGMGKSFGWSNRERGSQPENVNAWESGIDNIKNIHNRLKNTKALNKDFRKIFEEYNDPEVFMYLDPTYLKVTRTAKEVYEYEMSEKDHKDLLDIIVKTKCKILISGYASNLYDMYLDKWHRSSKMIVNHSAQNISKEFRTEIIWWNY